MSRLMIPVAVLLLAGCTHGQLASSKIQSQHLADIYQQQVLDNLAMFIENSQAMPHVVARNESHPETKANAIAYTTTLDKYCGSSTGQSREALAAEPVSDPEKVLAIRTMFQEAAGLQRGHGQPAQRVEVEEQVALQQTDRDNDFTSVKQSHPRAGVEFNTTKTDEQRAKIKLTSHQQNVPFSQHKFAAIPPPNYRSMYANNSADQHITMQQSKARAENDASPVSRTVYPKCGCKKCVAQRSAAAQSGSAIAQNNATSNRSCWYSAGKPKDVPENYDGKVGRYGKTCVWVPPGGNAEFKQLVTAVMKQSKKAPETSPPAIRETVAHATPPTAPASYRVVAASIALNGDPLAAVRETSAAAAEDSHEVRRPKSILEENPVQEFAVENESLKFDRELSLLALSSWEADDEGEDETDAAGDSGNTRVAEVGIQSMR